LFNKIVLRFSCLFSQQYNRSRVLLLFITLFYIIARPCVARRACVKLTGTIRIRNAIPRGRWVATKHGGFLLLPSHKAYRRRWQRRWQGRGCCRKGHTRPAEALYLFLIIILIYAPYTRMYVTFHLFATGAEWMHYNNNNNMRLRISTIDK